MGASVREFNYSVDLLTVLQWQDNRASKVEAIINNLQAITTEYNETFWENWVSDVFTLKTANDFGLCVWCIILGLPVILESQDPSPVFNFNRPENFDHAPFARNGNAVVLDSEDLRILLQLRAYKLMSAGYIEDVNRVLTAVFSQYGAGAVVAVDNSALAISTAMLWTYYINYEMSAQLFRALIYYDIFPRATGVRLVYSFNASSYFNFNRPQNFGSGFFYE